MNTESKEKLVENQDSLKSIPRRLTAPTPEFWKKVRKTMLWIGGTSTAILLGFGTAGVALPAILSTILSYGVAVGATGTALANLPVDWDKVKDQEEDK